MKELPTIKISNDIRVKMKDMNNKYNKRWEKYINQGVIRYYEIKIQRDLFGQLILEVFWGRKGTRFGGKKLIS